MSQPVMLPQAVLHFDRNGFKDLDDKKSKRDEPSKKSLLSPKTAKASANLSIDCSVNSSCIGLNMAFPPAASCFTAAKPLVSKSIKDSAEPFIDTSIKKTAKMSKRIKDTSFKGSSTTNCFSSIKK